MKKALCLLLACCLGIFAPSEAARAEAPNFAPDTTPAPGIVESADGFDLPLDIPLDIPLDSVDDQAQDFATSGDVPAVASAYEVLTNSTYSLVMDRPAGWTQIPGRYTLCFEENVANGQTPARMALTRKTLSAEPSEERITKQLISYLKTLQTQYETFDVAELYTDKAFAGQPGFGTEYTARKGDVTVKGYVIMSAIGKYLYAFHFSSSAAAYDSFQDMIAHLRDSVKISQ